MSSRIFITGTDTDVGKTYVSVGLLRAFNQKGLSTLGLKPVASGCFKDNHRLYNPDALALQRASSVKLPYHHINPYAFEEAIAPHIAAKKSGIDLTLQQLNVVMQSALEIKNDVCIIEGAGGWFTPLNDNETMADFVTHHRFKTIMIVRIQLGCINHALLTQRAIHAARVPMAGWIANCVTSNIAYAAEQIETLKTHLPTAFLGTVNNDIQPELSLNITKLIDLI